MMKHLQDLKHNDSDYAWLNNVPEAITKQAMKDLLKAYKKVKGRSNEVQDIPTSCKRCLLQNGIGNSKGRRPRPPTGDSRYKASRLPSPEPTTPLGPKTHQRFIASGASAKKSGLFPNQARCKGMAY